MRAQCVPSPALTQVEVIRSFTAKQPDELSLQVADVVLIYQRVGDGEWGVLGHSGGTATDPGASSCPGCRPQHRSDPLALPPDLRLPLLPPCSCSFSLPRLHVLNWRL